MSLQKYETDNDGYLINPLDWDREFSELTAEKENIKLGEHHWMVIHYIQKCFERDQIAVDFRFVVKHLMEELGMNKKDARNYMFKLFPYGYVPQVCKIAGMKRPRAWSVG